MTRHAAVRWWPLIGLVAMALLGLVVGKRSTGLDDWFLHVGRAHRSVRALLLFTDARLVVLLFAVVVCVALFQRRWRLAAAAAVTPVVAVLLVRVLKRLFGRELVGQLAYPSGHVTVTVVVLGMLLLVAGAATWMIVAAALVAVLGLVGQAVTHHYFTDTVGGVLLATSLLCVAVSVSRLDTCQPEGDLRHTSG